MAVGLVSSRILKILEDIDLLSRLQRPRCLERHHVQEPSPVSLTRETFSSEILESPRPQILKSKLVTTRRVRYKDLILLADRGSAVGCRFPGPRFTLVPRIEKPLTSLGTRSPG